MDADLSNRVADVPERFEPQSMRGELSEAEHLARYRWAAGLVEGKRVLDAGCGLGYGADALKRAGAARVVAVDVAEAVLEVAAQRAGEDVEFQVEDVRSLSFEAGSFDVVVCFEVIEHVEERDRVIEELHRVLAPEGTLVLSSPNRDVYVPGNPHHLHEYRAEELRSTLEEVFANVTLWRQHAWISSAVLDDEGFAADDGGALSGLTVAKVVGERPGGETYTLALAGDGPLPAPEPVAVMTSAVELRKWLGLYDEQQAVLRRQHEHFETLADQREEREELRRRLAETERLVGEHVAVVHERDELRANHEAAAARADRADAVVRAVVGSPSWRVTAPLRALKRLLG